MRIINTENLVPGLLEVDQDILDCKNCPQNPNAKIELGWGRPRKIAFIGQSPSPQNSEGLRGASGFDRYFFELINPLGIHSDDFYFTNLVKVPVNINQISKETLMHCARHVQDELDEVRPRIVLALGKYSYGYLKERLKGKSYRFLSLMHPGALKYGSMTRENWQKDLKQALQWGRYQLTTKERK